MKTKTLLAALAAVALFSGCQKEAPPEPIAATNGVSGAEVKDELKDAAAATGQYLSQKKDQVAVAMKDELRDLDSKIEALAEKSRGYTGTAKDNAQSALATLRAKREVAAEKLEELRAASTNAWQDVKSGFESAMQDLKRSYEEAKRKFKE